MLPAIEKVRPTARVELDDGNDGRDGKYIIAYYCPKCSRRIWSYARDNACDQCGTSTTGESANL